MARILDLAYGTDDAKPEQPAPQDRLYVVGAQLPAELLGLPNVTLVRGRPYTCGCPNTLWARGLRFERITDANPHKTLRDCILLVEEFPRLLAAGVGRMTLGNLKLKHVPQILMAIHSDVRTCARQSGSTIVVDLSLSRCAWLDVLGSKAGLPDPLARRALVSWLLAHKAARVEQGETLVVVDLAGDEDQGHFTFCAMDTLKDKGLVLQTFSRPDLPVHVIRLGGRKDRWDLRARQALHFDGVVLTDGDDDDDNYTDMPCVRVIDVCIATQDLSLLRKIIEDLPPELLQS